MELINKIYKHNQLGSVFEWHQSHTHGAPCVDENQMVLEEDAVAFGGMYVRLLNDVCDYLEFV